MLMLAALFQRRTFNHEVIGTGRRSLRLEIGAKLPLDLGRSILKGQAQEYGQERCQQRKVLRRLRRFERLEIQIRHNH